MTTTPELPRELYPFVAFPSVMRANGFPVAPEQTQDFIAATELLGPRSMRSIYHAALALFGPSPERRDEFDALFRMIFLGQSIAAPALGDDEDDVRSFDDRDGDAPPPELGETEESGAEATAAERLTVRAFRQAGEPEALRRFRRHAQTGLPRRRSRRLQPSKSGRRVNVRRALREAVRHDGELLSLPQLKHRQRQRRVLLLVDVSGSMKAQTEGHMRFAHTLMQSAERVEVFTLGTRLTRVSRALRIRNREQALDAASSMVADWDGGTRLGDALAAFLAVPRFAGFARGALVVVVSDGLERGDPAVLVAATERLSRLAWSVLWLTPLAGGGDFVPQTEAMVAILPHIDRLAGGADVAEICAHILDHARHAA